MADIKFQGDNDFQYRRPAYQTAGLMGLLIRMGVASNAKSAEKVLIGIGIFALLVMGYVWFKPSPGSAPAPLPGGALPGAAVPGQNTAVPPVVAP